MTYNRYTYGCSHQPYSRVKYVAREFMWMTKILYCYLSAEVTHWNLFGSADLKVEIWGARCVAKVENKQLSLWDLGLLEMYGKITIQIQRAFSVILRTSPATRCSFQPLPQHPTVAAENLRFNTPLATANTRWRLPSHTIVDCIADSLSVSTVCWHKRLLIEVVTVEVH